MIRALPCDRVGDDAGLAAGERPGLVAQVVDRHGQQRHGDPLAGGEQHVELAARRQRARPARRGRSARRSCRPSRRPRRTTSWPAFLVSTIRLATRLMPSASATEEPPYFCTTRPTGFRSVPARRCYRPAGLPAVGAAAASTGWSGTGSTDRTNATDSGERRSGRGRRPRMTTLGGGRVPGRSDGRGGTRAAPTSSRTARRTGLRAARRRSPRRFVNHGGAAPPRRSRWSRWSARPSSRCSTALLADGVRARGATAPPAGRWAVGDGARRGRPSAAS